MYDLYSLYHSEIERYIHIAGRLTTKLVLFLLAFKQKKGSQELKVNSKH